MREEQKQGKLQENLPVATGTKTVFSPRDRKVLVAVISWLRKGLVWNFPSGLVVKTALLLQGSGLGRGTNIHMT